MHSNRYNLIEEEEKKKLKQLASGEITDYVPGEQGKLD